jgi:ABC-type amino acid transport substrate-binding protein
MVIATTGNLKRKNLFGWIGRIFSAFWLVIGIILLAYLTSSITSVMTTLSLSNEINGWNDLNNKKVGVLFGSVAESFAKEKGFDYILYSQNDEAVKSLQSKNIDAVIGDAPVLEYYDFTNSNEPVKVVGKLFKPDKYGFGLRGNETLTKTITIEILRAQESGYLEELRLKYFGQAH